MHTKKSALIKGEHSIWFLHPQGCDPASLSDNRGKDHILEDGKSEQLFGTANLQTELKRVVDRERVLSVDGEQLGK